MSKKRGELEHLILRIYSARPDIVNDDKKLLATVWQMQGWSHGVSVYENLMRVSNPETITRIRRKLHEQGKIQYSKEAHERRMKEFVKYRDEYGNPVVVV